MLCKALKKHVRLDSIDSFIHRFRRSHPDKPCPSTPTVYRYIDMGMLDLNNSDLPMKLRRRVKGNRKLHLRMNKKTLGTSIDDRPNYIDDRLLPGDWEGDLIKGKRIASEPAVMTLTERLSRVEIIVKIPDYHAETCRDTLQAILANMVMTSFIPSLLTMAVNSLYSTRFKELRSTLPILIHHGNVVVTRTKMG